MISNEYNNFSVDGGIPEKMNGTVHIVHYTYDVVYHPFFRGIPPSTENLLQSFLKSPAAVA